MKEISWEKTYFEKYVNVCCIGLIWGSILFDDNDKYFIRHNEQHLHPERPVYEYIGENTVVFGTTTSSSVNDIKIRTL